MRKICRLALAAAALVTSLPAVAQKYTVKGTVAPEVKRVFLQHLENDVPDSVDVVQGTFGFEGEAGGRMLAYVRSADGAAVPVVLDGDVTVSLTECTARGTAENDSLTAWNLQLAELERPYRDQYKACDAVYRATGAVPDSMVAVLYALEEEISPKRVELVKRCCLGHMDAAFPIHLLRRNVMEWEGSDLYAIVDADPAFLRLPDAAEFRTYLTARRRQEVGELFADIQLADTAGVTHSLSDYVGRGRYVLVDFWASWCGPCRAEMPAVKAAYEQYHAKGFDIVGLSLDNNRKSWTAAIRSMNLTWTHLSDLRGWQSEAATLYGVRSIPQTLLFGPDGRVVASGLRGEELARKLAELLQ